MTIFIVVRGGVIVEAYEDKGAAFEAARKLQRQIPETVQVGVEVKPIYLVKGK
jgi:agmatine/peptidylarginine deiminase